MKKTVIDGKTYAFCERCQKFVIAHQQVGEFFDGGIDFTIRGGYGCYYDPFEEDEAVEVRLCHDCSVEVLKFIGVYNDPKFLGGHPTERDGEACCDNCWIPVTDGNGNWIGTKSPNGEIRYHK